MVGFPSLPCGSYSVHGQQEQAYLVDLAWRTGGFGFGVGLVIACLLALLVLMSSCCFGGSFFTAGRLAEKVLGAICCCTSRRDWGVDGGADEVLGKLAGDSTRGVGGGDEEAGDAPSQEKRAAKLPTPRDAPTDFCSDAVTVERSRDERSRARLRLLSGWLCASLAAAQAVPALLAGPVGASVDRGLSTSLRLFEEMAAEAEARLLCSGNGSSGGNVSELAGTGVRWLVLLGADAADRASAAAAAASLADDRTLSRLSACSVGAPLPAMYFNASSAPPSPVPLAAGATVAALLEGAEGALRGIVLQVDASRVAISAALHSARSRFLDLRTPVSGIATALELAQQSGAAASANLTWLRRRHGGASWAKLPFPAAVPVLNDASGGKGGVGGSTVDLGGGSLGRSSGSSGCGSNRTALARAQTGLAVVELSITRFEAIAALLNATVWLILGPPPPLVGGNGVQQAAALGLVAASAAAAEAAAVNASAAGKAADAVTDAVGAAPYNSSSASNESVAALVVANAAQAAAVAAGTAAAAAAATAASLAGAVPTGGGVARWFGSVGAGVNRSNVPRDLAEGALAIRGRCARLVRASVAAGATATAWRATVAHWRAVWERSQWRGLLLGGGSYYSGGRIGGGDAVLVCCWLALVPSISGILALLWPGWHLAWREWLRHRRQQRQREAERQTAADKKASGNDNAGGEGINVVSKDLSWIGGVDPRAIEAEKVAKAARKQQAREDRRRRAENAAEVRAEKAAEAAAVVHVAARARHAAQGCACCALVVVPWIFLLAGAVAAASAVVGDVCTPAAVQFELLAANAKNASAQVSLGRRSPALPRRPAPIGSHEVANESVVATSFSDAAVLRRVLRCQADASLTPAPTAGNTNAASLLGFDAAFDISAEVQLALRSLNRVTSSSGSAAMPLPNVPLRYVRAAVAAATNATGAGDFNPTSSSAEVAARSVIEAALQSGLDWRAPVAALAKSLVADIHVASNFSVLACGSVCSRGSSSSSSSSSSSPLSPYEFNNRSTELLIGAIAQQRALLPSLARAAVLPAPTWATNGTMNSVGSRSSGWRMVASDATQRALLQASFLDPGASLDALVTNSSLPSARRYPAFSWSLFTDAVRDVNIAAVAAGHAGGAAAGVVAVAAEAPYDLDSVAMLVRAAVAAHDAGLDAATVGLRVNSSLHYRTLTAAGGTEAAVCCTTGAAELQALALAVNRCRVYHTLLYGGLDPSALWRHSRAANAPGVLMDVLASRNALDGASLALRAQISAGAAASAQQLALLQGAVRAAQAGVAMGGVAWEAAVTLRQRTADLEALVPAAAAAANVGFPCGWAAQRWRRLASTAAGRGVLCGGATDSGSSGYVSKAAGVMSLGDGAGADLRILAAVTLVCAALLALAVPVLTVVAELLESEPLARVSPGAVAPLPPWLGLQHKQQHTLSRSTHSGSSIEASVGAAARRVQM